jgi:hypothetical protein
MPMEVNSLQFSVITNRLAVICVMSESSDDPDGVARTTFLGSILSRGTVGKKP